ncbi:MAG: DNA photolyase family protein [Pelagimonas sp.]|nr:DNA photolyase family protein [Pelagimonas sp.]
MGVAIVWIRRDLRLSDHPALVAASLAGAVVPVFIRDDLVDQLGAAPKWRLGLGLAQFSKALETRGLRLILRSGDPLKVLSTLAQEVGAEQVHWIRAYDPDSVARDTAVKAGLKAQGLRVESHAGHLLFEPWEVATRQGNFYQVYTPYWKAVRALDVGAPLAEPRLQPPAAWPASEALHSWQLGRHMHRGAEVVARHQTVGEAAARDRLGRFVDQRIGQYKERRDFCAQAGTSGLSENLAVGEISARSCWHAGRAALDRAVLDPAIMGTAGPETFLKELVWREFAYHLMWHTPHILTAPWREGWADFPWHSGISENLAAWQQGRTGVPLVDAGLREMYVTGTMHNRARMVVASYLSKHMLVDWRLGQAWFADCLTDWDVASNAMGWQWVAGCGPDAAPFFRIFNPVTQQKNFDPTGAYVTRWIAERQRDPAETALSFFDAIPRAWGLNATVPYPTEIVDLAQGRARALAAYQAMRG